MVPASLPVARPVQTQTTEYKVIWARSVEKLASDVQWYLNHGWEAQGGICVLHVWGAWSHEYYQSIIRKG